MKNNSVEKGKFSDGNPLLCLVKTESSEENGILKRKKGRMIIEVENDPDKDSRRITCAIEGCKFKASTGAYCHSHWVQLMKEKKEESQRCK